MSIGAKAARSWNEWEGQVVDQKFPLLRYLGSGANSAVFLTERSGGEPSKAAIKIVPLDGPSVDAQLSRWQAASQLSHPHLIRLFESGRAQLGGTSIAYVLMEYAEEDLSQVPRALTEEEAQDMLRGTLKALGYLHGKGLAHGHLKPSNIMAVADQLKISIDAIRPSGEWNAALDLSPADAPPEIAEGGASAAGDIWSLGVTLVEAATQQTPARDQGAAVAVLPARLPAVFRKSVLRSLRRDPAQRGTVADFERSLHPEPEPPSALPERLPEATIRAAAVQMKKAAQPRNVQATTAASPMAPVVTKKPMRRYLIPAGALVLTIAAAAILPRLTNSSSPTPAPAVAPAVSTPAPVASQTIVNPPAPTPPVPNPPAPSEATPDPAAPPEAAVPERPAQAGTPDVIKEVLPTVPAKARNTIRGKVAVSVVVNVDDSGSVTSAKSESREASRFFTDLALRAARQWKFSPAKNGSQEWTLRFRFFADAERPVTVQASASR